MKTTLETVKVARPEGSVGDPWEQSYQRVSFETVEDVLSALQSGNESDRKALIQDLNYGRDLKVRQGIRQQILDKEAGPDKAIAKIAKDLVKLYAAMGKTITEEKAMGIARAQMAAAESEPA